MAAAQEVKHIITKEDVDQFLANMLTLEELGAPKYFHEKMKSVAHRRLVKEGALVPAGLVNCMLLLVTDLESGKDGYDPKAYMPQVPCISVVLTPAMYPKLWKHLPKEFLTAFETECADMPSGCSLM